MLEYLRGLENRVSSLSDCPIGTVGAGNILLSIQRLGPTTGGTGLRLKHRNTVDSYNDICCYNVMSFTLACRPTLLRKLMFTWLKTRTATSSCWTRERAIISVSPIYCDNVGTLTHH